MFGLELKNKTIQIITFLFINVVLTSFLIERGFLLSLKHEISYNPFTVILQIISNPRTKFNTTK